MAIDRPISPNTEAFVFDKKATDVLKSIYASINQQRSDITDTLNENSAEESRRHKSEMVRSMAAERKNRAVTNALYGKVDKVTSILSTLQNALSKAFDKIISVVTENIKRVLNSFSDFAKELRAEKMSTAQIAAAGLDVSMMSNLAESMYDVKLARDEVNAFAKELIASNKNLAALTSEDKAAYTALRAMGMDNAKAYELATTANQQTLDALVKSLSDSTVRGTMLAQLDKTSLTELVNATEGRDIDKALMQLRETSENLAKNTGLFLGASSQAELGRLAQLFSSGQVQNLDQSEVATLEAILGNSLRDLTPERLGESIRAKVEEAARTGNQSDLQKLITIFTSKAGMDSQISKDMLEQIQHGILMIQTGRNVEQGVRSYDENKEALEEFTRDGRLPQKIDKLTSVLDEKTGGFISKAAAVMNEWVGDTVKVGNVVDGLNEIIKILLSIKKSLFGGIAGGAGIATGMFSKMGAAVLKGGAVALAAGSVAVAAKSIFDEYSLESDYEAAWAQNQKTIATTEANIAKYNDLYNDAMRSGNHELAQQYKNEMSAAIAQANALKLEQDKMEYEKSNDEKKKLLDFEKNEYWPTIKQINNERVKIQQSSLSYEEKQRHLADLARKENELDAQRKQLEEDTRGFFDYHLPNFFLETIPDLIKEALSKIGGLIKTSITGELAANALGVVKPLFEEYFIQPLKTFFDPIVETIEDFISPLKEFFMFDWLPGPIKKFLGISSGNGTARGESDYGFEDMAKDLASAAKESITAGLENSSASLKNWWDSWSLFANGGVVNSPTNAIIGEAGREAVLPLTNPTELANVLKSLSASEQLGLLKILLGKNMSVTPELVATSLQEVLGNRNTFTRAVASTAANIVANGAPGDDPQTINKILSYAGPYKDLVYSKITSGFKKRKGWYEEALSNAANQDGRDLIRGTYAERALEYGVSQLGKPYILNSLGKLGYVCNELVNACLQASGFDMGKFRVHGVRATFANIQKGKYGGTDYPNFRIRDDLTPQTAIPGMVFFQDARKNKEGGFQPGHIGLVYYGHQKLHSSGGSASYDKGTFLRDWQTPCRGVTVTPFDGSNYVIGEFPGLFEQASGELNAPTNSPASFGPGMSDMDTSARITSAIKNVSDLGLLTSDEIASIMAQTTGVSTAIAAQYATQAMKLMDGKNQDEVIAVLIEIAKVLKGIAISNMGNRPNVPVSRPAASVYH